MAKSAKERWEGSKEDKAQDKAGIAKMKAKAAKKKGGKGKK